MTKDLKDGFENNSIFSDINRILNMTNKEAAEVLENVKMWTNFGRRNGKTRLVLAYNKAIEKAITALRKEVLYVCDQTRCENCSAKDGHCFMTSEITHAANFIDAGDGIYVEKTPIIAADLSELPDYIEPLPDYVDKYIREKLGESEEEE